VTLYLPGDAIKAVVAALVARGVHAGYPGLLTRRRDTRQATPV
jgi:biotin transport system substrate-specific component